MGKGVIEPKGRKKHGSAELEQKQKRVETLEADIKKMNDDIVEVERKIKAQEIVISGAAGKDKKVAETAKAQMLQQKLTLTAQMGIEKDNLKNAKRAVTAQKKRNDEAEAGESAAAGSKSGGAPPEKPQGFSLEDEAAAKQAVRTSLGQEPLLEEEEEIIDLDNPEDADKPTQEIISKNSKRIQELQDSLQEHGPSKKQEIMKEIKALNQYNKDLLRIKRPKTKENKAIEDDTSTKPKTETKSVEKIPVELPSGAQNQANLAGGMDMAAQPMTATEKGALSSGLINAYRTGEQKGGEKIAYQESSKFFKQFIEPNKARLPANLYSQYERYNKVDNLAQSSNAALAGQTDSKDAVGFDDNSQNPRIVNPATSATLSQNGANVNPEVSQGSNVVVPPNPATQISKTDDGQVKGDVTSPLLNTIFNQIDVPEEENKKDAEDMASLQFPIEDEAILGANRPTMMPASDKQFMEEEFMRVVGPRPPIGPNRVIPVGGSRVAPQMRQVQKAFTPQEMQFLMKQRDEITKSSMQSQINQDMKANAENTKTIGDRMRVGLDMYGDIPKADILVKSDNERLKSLHSFSNHRWIESIQNSKRGNRSVLKEMENEEDKLRYGYTYMPSHIEPPPSQEELIMKNMNFINTHISQRFTPARDNITELSREGRCVGAEPPKMGNVGEYNYRHEGVYGTTDLGLARVTPEELMPDYRLNTLIYPNILYDMENARYRYL